MLVVGAEERLDPFVGKGELREGRRNYERVSVVS